MHHSSGGYAPSSAVKLHFLSGVRNTDVIKIVELECYKALAKIKAIIEDDALADSECFQQIEEIVCAFEALGSGGGSRHDFG